MNKEEIEEYKQTLFDLIDDENVYNSIKEAVKETYKYIDQLEKENKDLQLSVDQIYDDYQDIGKMYFNLNEKVEKLIDKLESDKMEQFDDYIIYLIESYLEIVKGEKNV